MRAKAGWLSAGVLIALAARAPVVGATPPGKDPEPPPSSIEQELEGAHETPPPPATHRHTAPRTRTPQSPEPVPRGRGGGPQQPCPSIDAPAGGPCVSPDLSPDAPQRDWDRDPRMQRRTTPNDQPQHQAFAPTH